MNKKLLDRIISLEEELGLAYSPGDGKDGYNQHLADNYGPMADLKKIRDEFSKKKK